jgi:PAS domain S-box-containing protein
MPLRKIKNDPEIPKNHGVPLRRHSWRVPLRYKLALPTLVLMLGVVIFVLFTTFHVFHDMMVKYKEARLQAVAEIFAETLKIPMASDDQASLHAYIQLLAEQTGADEVCLRSVDGKKISSGRSGTTRFSDLSYPQNFYGVREVSEGIYASVVPIRNEKEPLGQLIIVFSRGDFERELREIFIEKFFISFLLVTLVAFAIAGLTWVVMRPMTALQKTARNILAGDLEARADIHSSDEIQELGEAFNKVVSRLVQSFEHLRARTQALEESEEKYRSIVDNVSDIIFSITPEGELLVLNRGFSGYSREEILAEGLPLFFSMHAPGEAQKFQDALEMIMRTKRPVEHLNTQQFHRLHHTEIYYQTNLTPVVDYEGSLRLIQGVMRDVTDLRRVEMMKETLVRDVAHELKTPTAKFIMTLPWLEKNMADNPEKEKFMPILKMLSENADRLMRTISSIMDLSKVESGMSDIRKQEIDLNDVLRLVAEDMRPLIEQNHLKLETRLSAAPLRMLGDPDMLYRVFVNLITNAAKFTPDGTLTVTSSVRGNDLCAEVADTGIGIEPENLQRIFEAFFQKTPSTLGIGVGLTISKEIVALHEGEIWAESGGAGQGSVFKVIFPSCSAAGK